MAAGDEVSLELICRANHRSFSQTSRIRKDYSSLIVGRLELKPLLLLNDMLLVL